MSGSPPTPPAELPPEFVDTLNDCSSEALRQVARYVEDLAEYREEDISTIEKGDEKEERPEDLPEDVPSKATITIKEINDNRYYYWQWREGEQIKSKYKGPVNPDE